MPPNHDGVDTTARHRLCQFSETDCHRVRFRIDRRHERDRLTEIAKRRVQTKRERVNPSRLPRPDRDHRRTAVREQILGEDLVPALRKLPSPRTLEALSRLGIEAVDHESPRDQRTREGFEKPTDLRRAQTQAMVG